MDISEPDTIKERLLKMRDHQLMRIEWFLTLGKIKSNEFRSKGLVDYKRELETLIDFDLESLKKVARSGDLIEEWQE